MPLFDSNPIGNMVPQWATLYTNTLQNIRNNLFREAYQRIALSSVYLEKCAVQLFGLEYKDKKNL